MHAQSHVPRSNLHICAALLLISQAQKVGMLLTGPAREGQFPQLRWELREPEKARRELRKRDGEKERKGRKRRSEIYSYTSIARRFLFWLLFKGGSWKIKHFCTLTLKFFWPPSRAYAQKENPLTLPGLLQILTGLSCKAGRHTETTRFNTVTLVCTLSSLPRANDLLLDIWA